MAIFKKCHKILVFERVLKGMFPMDDIILFHKIYIALDGNVM